MYMRVLENGLTFLGIIRTIKLRNLLRRIMNGGKFMIERQKNITISDVAEALGVSKTTVSRAISGKGRIGEATRQRVLAYIEEYDYKPNVIAKSLAQSKTFNLCVVMPGDYALVDLPFFQEVIMGIQEIAGMQEYDLLLCICQEKDVSSLARIIQNRKVDGVILLRTFVKDAQIELLQKKKLPFVTVGSTNYEGTVQIDHDHESACRELTTVMLARQVKKMALLGGNESYVVTQNRYRGYEDACRNAGKEINKSLLFMNLESKASVDKAVEDALRENADCLICMDDAICSQVLRKLRQENCRVPEQVKLASFYNSSVLENSIPTITSLSFDAKELGMVTCKTLLDLINGQEVAEKTLLSYEVVLKESTK